MRFLTLSTVLSTKNLVETTEIISFQHFQQENLWKTGINLNRFSNNTMCHICRDNLVWLSEM